MEVDGLAKHLSSTQIEDAINGVEAQQKVTMLYK